MLIRRNFVAVAALLALTGCGSDSPDSNASAPITESEPLSESGRRAANIAVPAGFDFSTSQSLEIQVITGATFSSKLYLTVCRNLPASAEEPASPDLERCLSRSPILNGSYQGEIELPNDVDALTATLWSYNPAGIVKTVAWNREANGMTALVISP